MEDENKNLEEETTNEEKKQAEETSNDDLKGNSKEENNNSKKGSSLPIIVILILLALGVLAYFFLLPKGVTITFKDGETVVSTQKLKNGEGVKLPVVDKEDYVFTGWYNNDAIVTEGQTFEKDATVIAKWDTKENTMTITFDTDGGNVLDEMTITCDSALYLPTPTKEGYNFLDWRDRNDIVISNETKLVCEDINLKANWKKVESQNNNNNKSPESKPAAYECPTGYTLEGTKCVFYEPAKTKCGDREFEYEGRCVKITGSDRRDTQNSCGKTTINLGGGHTEEVQGELFKLGTNFCFFKEVTDSYEQQSRENCTSRSHAWNSQNNKCYYMRGDANQYVISTCNHLSGYEYIPNPNSYQGVNGLNGGCYPLNDKTKYCLDGWTLSNDKCTKTIDATKKNNY